MKEKKSGKITIVQTGSNIGCPKKQKLCLTALGLGKIGRSSTLNDDPCVRGLVRKVSHLVRVVEGD